MTAKDIVKTFFRTRGKGRPPKTGYKLQAIDDFAVNEAYVDGVTNWTIPSYGTIRRTVQEMVAEGTLRRVSTGFYARA